MCGKMIEELEKFDVGAGMDYDNIISITVRTKFPALVWLQPAGNRQGV
jgi:hypothetical protein